MPRKYRWDKKYLAWGITAFFVIVASIIFFWILNHWLGLKTTINVIIKAISPIIYGLVFAYLLSKLVTFFETRFMQKFAMRLFSKRALFAKKLARILSIVLALGIAIVVVGGLLALVLPKIIESIQSLVAKMPGYITNVTDWITKFLSDNPELESAIVNLVGNVSEYFTNWLRSSVLPQADQLLSNIYGGVLSIVTVMFDMLVGLIISVYVLYRKETFGAQCKKMFYGLFKPKRANQILSGFRMIDRTCGSYIAGTLIDALLVGIVCYAVLLIIGMPYAELVSVIVCLTNVIPFFGPFIGAIPSAFLILLEDPLMCLVFVIFIIILQQIDGNIITPQILGDKIGMSGFWIMFSILLFGGLFGFMGMLLGVPVFAVIYELTSRLSRKRLASKNLPIASADYIDITYIDPETNIPVYKNEPPAAPEETEANTDDKEDR